ncbi:uncharacterized protein LOC124300240 isoform X1 [Neodiprion virginianus]|uniref:uncharacterized protein LOC124300240 isoform X1 n=1 Tax=Neodiprion virginianus TaxID=2961670 RepID=UPI001EE696A5|nr:uncharacterized protein LOC124300240 isoform X1 [Neodiprion virginianus]
MDLDPAPAVSVLLLPRWLQPHMNVVDVCFGAPGDWSDILFSENMPIHGYRRTHNSLKHGIFTVTRNDFDVIPTETSAELLLRHHDHYIKTLGKPNAVVMHVDRVDDLEPIMANLKYSTWRTWRTRIRYLLIVPKTICNVADCNRMFKVIWNYWILNAVILCSSNDTEDFVKLDRVKLYTYNPYSSDHSQRWETVLQETIEVPIEPDNFNHSWHVFRKDFTAIQSLADCEVLFFDKTLNMDGYLIPISMFLIRPKILLDPYKPGIGKWIGPDGLLLRTLATKLKFNVAEVFNGEPDLYGQLLANRSYTGELKLTFYGLSNIVTDGHLMGDLPGLEMTYPHSSTGVCFASRVAGLYPQWTNIFVAQNIWIGLGLGTILITVILYLRDKSQGLIPALLNAERFILGNSIIRLPESIEYRLIFGSIFLAFIVIDGIFRGRFISILAIARRLPNLDTLEQVKAQGVEIYGYGPLVDLIDDPVLKKGYHDLRPERCLARIEQDGQQRACLAQCLTLPALTADFNMAIHKASTIIGKNYAVYISTLNWPMTDRWNFDIQKLVEAGVINKWREDLGRDMELKSWRTKRAAEQPYFRPVELDSLFSAFVILVLGLLIALISFAWEMRARRRVTGEEKRAYTQKRSTDRNTKQNVDQATANFH